MKKHNVISVKEVILDTIEKGKDLPGIEYVTTDGKNNNLNIIFSDDNSRKLFLDNEGSKILDVIKYEKLVSYKKGLITGVVQLGVVIGVGIISNKIIKSYRNKLKVDKDA